MNRTNWQLTVGLFLAILGLGMIFMLFLPDLSSGRQLAWAIAGIVAFFIGFSVLAFSGIRKKTE